MLEQEPLDSNWRTRPNEYSRTWNYKSTKRMTMLEALGVRMTVRKTRIFAFVLILSKIWTNRFTYFLVENRYPGWYLSSLLAYLFLTMSNG